MDLNGKVVVITGASSGIGRSLTVKFVEKGAAVVMASRSKEKLEGLSRQLSESSYNNHIVCATDVTKKEQVQNLVDTTMEKFGKVDILVNCAGAGMYGKISEADIEQIRHIFDLNFFGSVYAIQKVYPIMAKAGRGIIINISSTAGFRSWPNNGYYCATKHALNAISESLMLEAKKEGIDILLVMPGTINTSFINNSWNLPDEVKNNPPMDMTPDAAAEVIIKAVLRHKKKIVLTTKGKVLYYLNRFSPALVDRILEAKT